MSLRGRSMGITYWLLFTLERALGLDMALLIMRELTRDRIPMPGEGE